ncbi:MAG TPA: helicase-related protein, partial [Acidimicrobiia bacterium]|nr:helicase-related protein [Acidimicrobiia bacterium]
MSGAGERDAPAVSGTLASARALIARELLDAHDPTLSLGAITLHPHQRRAVVRISKLLASHGGALLADPTGLGKTYVALAVASDVDHLLIVCPAALRENWTRALDRAGRTAQLISRERLSRGIPDQTGAPELVIVDESHHLRNPNTKCYDAVASLCDRRRILLLSATPVQNRRDDLIAQLALFLGGAAYEMTDQELARFVVRRDTADSLARLPTVVGPHWITLPVEDDVLDEIMRLPPCVPLADEGKAHALLRYVLLRQWSSSHAALIAGLRARLARGVALLAALDAGRRPTRRELTAWSHTEDAVQLALPEMLVPLAVAPEDGTALRESAVEHVAAVRALLNRLRGVHDADLARSDALRELRRRHGDARIIAFSQYAATVRGLSQLLMHRDGGVAELTGRGGRVAGGRLSRAEVLAQFSPGTPHVGAAERIDLLLTTDLASEGLDLQRASVVVHLDLPWNPARLEQRVGRVRRLGGQHERVFVYAMAPPARSEHVLDVETRLRAKLRVAAHVIGLTSTSLPDIEADDVDAPPALTSDVYTALECWRSADDAPKSDPDAPSLYAAAH